MTLLRIFLIAAFLAVLAYTLLVAGRHGFDLVSVFMANIAAVNWSGQFNLDFLTYLLLSAGWVAWRHNFSGPGLLLGLIASVGGMLFLAVYLLVVSFRSNGDMRTLLLGETRAHGA